MACCYFECLLFPEVKQKSDDSEEPLLEKEDAKKTKNAKCSVVMEINGWKLTLAQIAAQPRKLWQWMRGVWTHKRFRKCRKITWITLAVLLLLAFLAAFVGLPLVFMSSIQIQRNFIFSPTTAHHTEFFVQPNYDYLELQNFYVTINKTERMSLGVWDMLRIPQSRDRYGYEVRTTVKSTLLPLKNSSKPVLLHFHREFGNRRWYRKRYEALTYIFRVIAFDYRSYGDSSTAELTEEGMLEDSVELYKWLRLQTTADIYVWGDSLGAAIATHTVAKLRSENIIPTGLVLENAFTTLAKQLEISWISKMLSWLPWFQATILDSMERNGFQFKTSENILEVDCPIMIWHVASGVVPAAVSEELYDIATEKRDTATQGSVTYAADGWYDFSSNNNAVRKFIQDCSKHSGKNTTLAL